MRSNPTQIAEVIENAAEYLKEYGWRQLKAGVHGESRCLVGALSSAAGTYALHMDARKAVESHLWLAAAVWNDMPGRTKEEVIDALIGTAKDLRNQ
jgi:hypothetical protein